MLRRTLLAIAPLAALALTGCNHSDELPTVPSPPPPGSVKAESGGPATLPPEAAAKLKNQGMPVMKSDVQAN